MGLLEIPGSCLYKGRWDPDRVELLHLLPDVALPEGHVDHRRLDIGVTHRLHDGEGIGSCHGHLGPERVAQPMNANVGDPGAFTGPIQALPDIV